MDRSRPSIDDLLEHSESVRALALRLCGDAHAVDDGMQDVWLQALRRPPVHGRNVGAWLRRTLGNALRMRGRQDERRRQREATVARPADAAYLSTSELAARAELHRELVAGVLRLPEPQRRLVLLHYFEGVDVAELARWTGSTPDAVRAHLRRARKGLRAELERGDSRAAFAALVLAVRPAAAGPATMTGAAAAAAGVAMSMHVKLLAGAAALALAVWFLLPSGDAPAPTGPGAELAGAGQPLNAEVTVDGPVEETDPALASQRTPVPLPVEPELLSLQGRLLGLHPNAPWTKPVEVKVQARGTGGWNEHEERVPVDVDGSFPVRVPAWAREGRQFELTLRAEDPWYENARVEFGEGALTGDQPVVVHVRPVGMLTGRVVDPQGEPVPAARVLAFAAPNGVPQGPAQAVRTTGLDGVYRLPVPVAAPLLVVAVPIQEMNLSGHRMTMYGGGIADNGQPRDDLLSAATWAESAFGKRSEPETMILEQPAWVTGVVVWPDGKRIADAKVDLRAKGAAALDEDLRLSWVDNVRVALSREVKATAEGTFRIPAHAGCLAELVLTQAEGVYFTPGKARVPVTAPQDVELRLSGKVVRVRIVPPAGRDPTEAIVDWTGDGFAARIAVGQEDLRLLLTNQRCHVRASARGLASELVELSDESPDIVELQLEDSSGQTAVTVELLASHPVRQATFYWQPRGSTAPGWSRSLQRGDGHGPFRMEVAPGSYTLYVLPAHGERNGTFLLNTHEKIEVPAVGGHFDVRVQLGGRIAIHAVDRNGLHVGGEVQLRGPDGRTHRPELRLQPARRSGRSQARLTPGGPNETAQNLPAGRYEVVLDLGPHGVHRREVDVRVREVVEVRVALR